MTDAQQVRERLAADGHREAAPERAQVRVVNTCCVTAEAVAKSRKAVRRAARTADRVLVTGCAAALEGAFDGLPRQRDGDLAPLRAAGRGGLGHLGGLGCTGLATPPFARTRAYSRSRTAVRSAAATA